MKTRMTKILSMLMALALIIAIAACSNTGSNTPSTPSAPSASETKTPNTVKEGEKVKLTFAAPAKANVTEWNENKLTLWLEEKTGYDLEYVHFAADNADLKTQLATMTTANEKRETAGLNADILRVSIHETGENPDGNPAPDTDGRRRRNLCRPQLLSYCCKPDYTCGIQHKGPC